MTRTIPLLLLSTSLLTQAAEAKPYTDALSQSLRCESETAWVEPSADGWDAVCGDDQGRERYRPEVCELYAEWAFVACVEGWSDPPGRSCDSAWENAWAQCTER